MDKPVRVLLADDNRDFVEVLKAYIQSQEHMEIVGVAYNGREALNLIYQESPDVVVLDMIMPLLDGLGVLEKLQFEEKRPHVIVLSAFGQESIARQANNLGTDYYILKPFDLDILGKRIRQIFSETDLKSSSEPSVTNRNISQSANPITTARNLKAEVTYILHQMGVPAHVKGYLYLRDSIICVVQNVSLIGAITKDLYPVIAAKYKTTPSRVERGIRHAIELAWERGNDQFKKEFFGCTLDTEGGRPTNSEFIATVADKLRMLN